MFIVLLLDFVFMRVYNGTPLAASEILNCEVWDRAHALSTALAFIVNQGGGPGWRGESYGFIWMTASSKMIYMTWELCIIVIMVR